MLPTLINSFCERFAVEHSSAVSELASMQLNVGVLLVKANGQVPPQPPVRAAILRIRSERTRPDVRRWQVALPHSMCADDAIDDPVDALKDFVSRLRTEPLLLKAYTAQAIVSMQDRLEEDDVAQLVSAANFAIKPIDEHFSDLSKLSHASLRHYAVDMLDALAKTGDAKLIKTVCRPTEDLAKAPFPPFDPSQARPLHTAPSPPTRGRLCGRTPSRYGRSSSATRTPSRA